jgi:prolyl oligopeptidase
VDFSDTEVVREWAVSKDGTKIPMSVIRRKGIKLDGTAPTLLTGYGGFDISLAPSFRPNLRLWLEHGGVYVVANLRGGGEYGEAWHHAGSLTRKQNVFDDFAACAKHLVDARYTKQSNLAIIGGSNGGLLMGAALVQHPDMFRAVVSFVGIYDMLRSEVTTPNAIFNITEFGSVKDAAQFRALYAYSPYQHVTDGTAYPAVLLLTGANDPRVNPANSRKMTARLQAATSSKAPILLRTSSNTGHGIDSSLDEQIEEGADVWAFLFDQLGLRMEAKPK